MGIVRIYESGYTKMLKFTVIESTKNTWILLYEDTSLWRHPQYVQSTR